MVNEADIGCTMGDSEVTPSKPREMWFTGLLIILCAMYKLNNNDLPKLQVCKHFRNMKQSPDLLEGEAPPVRYMSGATTTYLCVSPTLKCPVYWSVR